MIAPGMVSDARKIVVLASQYQWQFNPGALTAVEIDDEGNVTKDLVPPSNRDTPEMLFVQPAYAYAIIGMRLGNAITAYTSEPGVAHAFPRAFVEPARAKTGTPQWTVPTLLFTSGKNVGRRIYFFKSRDGRSPLPPVPPHLTRLASDTLIALPTPMRDTHSVFEVPPSDFGNLTNDPYMPSPPPQLANVERMGRIR